jgi:cyclic pyranopterin phosphate synthase
MSGERPFTHLDEAGRVRMVDVSAKPVTSRRAVASAVVCVGAEVFERLAQGGLPKGDALAAARLAGIMAAKKTAELIPLCHSLAPEYVEVRIELAPPEAVRITAEARIEARTGVEMEALVAASVAALTIYDMCKSISRGMVIGPIRLEEKSGGTSRLP